MAIPEYERAFKFWCQKVLPAVYDDSLSYYEQLCKVVKFLNDHIGGYNMLVGQVTDNTDLLTSMSDLLTQIKNGKYADLYLDQLEAWINENLINYVARMAFYVFPTLQYDSNKKVWRYCIKVPQSWKQLKFRWTWDTSKHVWYLALYY